MSNWMEMLAPGRKQGRILRPELGVVTMGILALTFVTVTAGPFVLVTSLVTGGMWALVAVGLALVFGVMNIANFAQGEVFMVGTLAAFLTYTVIETGELIGPAWLSAGAALGAGAGAGALLGLIMNALVFAPMRRRDRPGWLMDTFVVTVGISVMLIHLHQLVWGNQYKGIVTYLPGAPVKVLDVPIGRDRLMVLVLSVVMLLGLWMLLRFSQLGRAIRAVAQDEVGARMMGVRVRRIHALTLGLSSALAGLAGAALLFMFPSFPHVGVQPLYVAWTVVILAGLGSIGGAIVGGFIVALFQASTAYFVGTEWQDVLPFVLIIIVLILRPHGLFGAVTRQR